MQISPKEKADILALARSAVESQVLDQRPPRCENPTGTLERQLGCFVTLTNAGRLRGCIGTFMPRGPLWSTLVEMGRAAARDDRFVFDPISPGELSQLKVEVSVLGPLERTTQPQTLQVGTHGIYIIQGRRGGCFLPEVATEQGWDAVEFLSQCCAHKAGLGPDAWRDEATEVYLFTSDKLSE